MTASNATSIPATTTPVRRWGIAFARIRSAIVIAAVALAPACYSPTGTSGTHHDPESVFILPDSDLSATLRDADDDEVASLDVAHHIGTTDCPQLLGTLTVDNAADADATAALAVPSDPPLAIVISEAQVQVPAGESVEIEIMFDCSATDDIDTTMDLALQTGGRIGSFSIGLSLDVMDS